MDDMPCQIMERSGPMIGHLSGPEDFVRHFDVSRETIKRLETYASLLLKWQKAVNLVSPATLDDIWRRHFADSAQLACIMASNSDSFFTGRRETSQGLPDRHRPDEHHQDGIVWLDLGSGGGFPALVLAIMFEDRRLMDRRGGGRSVRDCSLSEEAGGVEFHLVESNGRKCAFLSEVARQLGISVTVHNKRIERLDLPHDLPMADFVSARALAPLDRLLAFSRPLARDEARAFFFKGRDALEEVAAVRTARAAGNGWEFECRAWPSRTARGSHIVEIGKWRNIEHGS